ncbi:helix-turn-helix domain-containing protein [Enterococcus faecium]|nr:helix-turn-helix domain-containing protein [Enterococcus faecium]
MEQLKAYKFRICSLKEQEMFFGKSFGCVHKVYNLRLDYCTKAYGKTKNNSSKKMRFSMSVKYKEEFPYLKEHRFMLFSQEAPISTVRFSQV